MVPEPLDLFGLPVDPRHGLAGRPRHMPTAETRAAVARHRGAGLRHDEIAAAIGITAPTLRLNYRDELNSNSQTSQHRLARDHERNDR